MRFASLGSGSAGNALVAEAGATRILLDCGFGLRETASRLNRLGLLPDQISAILITHEHDDHVGGAFKFAARYRIPLYLTYGTLAAVRDVPEQVSVHIIDAHQSFVVGEFDVMPFPVPHDAREPVQFVLGDGMHRLGVLTDTGSITSHIESMLSGCDALVLECNHDLEMLMNGDYPKSLKQRIASNFGHLDNMTASSLLSNIDCGKLQHLVAAHLSEKNNRPSLARGALSQALGCTEDWVQVADQEAGLGWLDIR